ncbi:MAG: VOC family protein [Gammaproteobacteria bacterium]|nr:VOC family protein [Gammaproteobacteria bacterium]
MRRFLASLAGVLMLTGLQADSHEPGSGYATLIRTTVLARLADLQPSITFWRDVMGFDYAGDPEPRTGFAHPLGWNEDSTTYFTTFTSKDGAMFALLMVEDTPGFPALDLPESGTAYGGIVLVHMGRNIGDVYDRAVAHGVDIVKPYGPSRTGRSMTILLRAPTGHMVEIYEMIEQDH